MSEAALCSVHLPPAERESPTQFSKRRALTGPQFLEGGCWERGEWVFSGGGGLQFLHNKELKSEVSNDKKSLLAKMLFCHN